MNLSGILVVAQREWLEQVVQGLNAMAGVEVHQVEPETGRVVLVQEAADIHAEVDGLKQIKAIPHVIMAEMVYHYIAEDGRDYAVIPPGLEGDEAGFGPRAELAKPNG